MLYHMQVCSGVWFMASEVLPVTNRFIRKKLFRKAFTDSGHSVLFLANYVFFRLVVKSGTLYTFSKCILCESSFSMVLIFIYC